MPMNGIVYFIQQDVTYAVKIGFTANLKSLAIRRHSLQTASPYALRIVHYLEGDVEVEQALHKRFERDRLIGEWFKPSVELAECIGEHKAAAARLQELTGT